MCDGYGGGEGLKRGRAGIEVSFPATVSLNIKDGKLDFFNL